VPLNDGLGERPQVAVMATHDLDRKSLGKSCAVLLIEREFLPNSRM